MANFHHDLRVALRTLMARPAFTAAAVLTLGLGIGSTTTVFSVAFGVLIRPLPFPESPRLVHLWQTDRRDPRPPDEGVSSPVNDEDWRRARSLSAVSLYSGTNVVLNEGAEPELMRAATVATDFFRVFGRALALGREFSAAEDRADGPRAVILSHGLWQERFGGDASVLGRTINISARPWQVVGVAPASFDFPAGTRLWIPTRNDDSNCGRDCVFMNGVARLRDGVTLEAAQQELDALARQIEREFPGANANTTFQAMTLQDSLVGPVQRPLYILLGAIILVLLIACANVANLLLVRGSARTAEIAVRATLGASRVRLLTQLLTESALLAALGGGLGLLTANWALDAVLALSPGDLPRLSEVRLDLPALLFTLGLTAVTTLVFGLLPAYQLARVPLAPALRQGGRGNINSRSTGRSLLLVAEVCFSVVLLIGAGLLVRSFLRIQSVDLGFDPNGVGQFVVSLPSARYDSPDRAVQFHHELQTRLRALPGIDEVSLAAAPPLTNNYIVSSFRRLDRPPPEPGSGMAVVLRVADPAFLRVLKMPLLAGRMFQVGDRQGAPGVALISQAAAQKFWRGENPIGKQIRLGINFGYDQPEAVTIIGVTGDIKGLGLTMQPEAEVFVPFAQSGNSSVTVLFRTRGDIESLLTQARAALRRMDPNLAFIRPGRTTDEVERKLAAPRFYMTLLTGFALLAMVLAVIGIYGVVAYMVAQRTREIGVRIALGAQISSVVRLVLWQGLRPALLGVTSGVVIALAAARVLETLLYETAPRDPMTLVGVPVLVLAAVIAACVLPARKASRTPAYIALQAENG